MLKRRRIISILLLVCFTCYMLLVTGCGDDDVAAPEASPPDLPPATSFVMDFADFTEGGSLEAAQGLALLQATRANWTYAGLNVLVWNTIITVGLAVPAASFIAAFGHQPVLHPGGDWVWSYNFYVNEVLHLAELHGRIEDEEVIWEMYISKDGEFADFLWYSGVSDIDGTEGSWTINREPEDPTPLIRIDWHNNIAEETWDIKYTNIIPGDAENGGYIYHGVVDDPTYDAFYDIYHKSADNHTYIEWNLTTKAGRVKDEAHFGDSDWHCWNNLLEDIDCP